MNPPRETIATLRGRIEADPQLAPLLASAAETSKGGPATDVEHVLRIAVWTLRFLPAGADERAAIAAALLHHSVEVARDEVERTRAGERNAARAARLLTGAGFSPEGVRDICIAIRDHSHAAVNVPTTDIGAALQDADRLEALGTLSILRTIATGARASARAGHRGAGLRTVDDRALNVAHFFVKLLRLPSLMRTEAGRVEAARRATAVRRFITEMADDVDAHSVAAPDDGERE